MESRRLISSENVAPSSPTPPTLRSYKLSMLDQIVPSMLVPFVLYYPAPATPHPHSHTTNQLKQSLSRILTRFYPLAGRVTPDGQSIDCADQGVPFTVVSFSLNLSDILTKPDEKLPHSLLPCDIAWETERCPDSTVAMVQVNRFDCGGIAVGLVFWHKAVDAVAVANFVGSWANANRGSVELSSSPDYVAQRIFPPKPKMRSQTGSISSILKTGASVMRRYTFDAEAIMTLRSRVEGGGRRASRVEAVSAVLWKCFMAASKANGHAASLLTHAVNLRRRAEPNFPSASFGNFPGLAASSVENREVESEGFELGRLVRKMRDAVGKIDADFVARLRGDRGMSGYLENLRVTGSDVHEKADLLSISSWCGFGLYGVDFGFGKPVWMTRCDSGCDSGSRFANLVWLMDTRDGDGVEAWVILDEKYMSVFEDDKDLRALACRDRSPLIVSSN